MDLDLEVRGTSLYAEITQLSTCRDICKYQSIMRISPRKDLACVFALSFRQSVAHTSVDYGDLGRVINTLIATQAQGLAHSEVITCSPVGCSPSPSLSHKTEHSPAETLSFSTLKLHENHH